MTRVGAIIHTIALAFHNLTHSGHTITVEDVKTYAEDIAKLANIYNEVKTETSGITDPAAKVEAICGSILKHESELPDDLQGTHLEGYITQACHELSGLSLETIEGIVKSYLAANGK